MNITKKISVVIVLYNNYDLVDNLLESIWKINDIGEQLEIIVVDNSDDKDTLFQKKHLNVNYIVNDNKGFGSANNSGFAISRGEYVLFLNPDTILVEPIFRFAIKKFEFDNVDAFGVQLVDKNMRKNMSFFWISNDALSGGYKLKKMNRKGVFIQENMFISGANLFIKRDVFKTVGGFDENIFLYNEDLELAVRLNENNFTTKYYPEKRIIHLERSNSTEESFSAFKMRMESLLYVCKKNNWSYIKKIKKIIIYTRIKYILRKISRKNAQNIINYLKKELE